MAYMILDNPRLESNQHHLMGKVYANTHEAFDLQKLRQAGYKNLEIRGVETPRAIFGRLFAETGDRDRGFALYFYNEDNGFFQRAYPQDTAVPHADFAKQVIPVS